MSGSQPLAGRLGRSPLLGGRRGVSRRETVRAAAAGRPIWTDRWALALLFGGVLLIGLLAFALWRRFDALPELIAIHFNAYGEVDLIGSKAEIFKLPLIGVLVWAANGAIATVASPYDRVLARVALGAAVLVEVLFCIAVWRIVT